MHCFFVFFILTKKHPKHVTKTDTPLPAVPPLVTHHETKSPTSRSPITLMWSIPLRRETRTPWERGYVVSRVARLCQISSPIWQP